MTKRCGNHHVINGKKPKLDDDEIWDDDLDAEALDKCFELATQVCADDVTSNEVSILPSYNVFKNPAAFASSTQANTTSIPSTSNKLSLQELEYEIQRLKQQNEEKEGEIAILRCKIKETNVCIQVEQQKTTNEWREKFRINQKEVKSTKSDLEFKNLEIANLKQQLAELRRINLDSTLNNPPQFVAPQPVVVNSERATKKAKQEKLLLKEAILEPIYPLKTISPESFINKSEECHMIKNTSYKTSRNTIPYLQNQQTYNEKTFRHKCLRLGNKKITIEHIYPDVFKLVNSNLEELNSADCIEAINKILCVAVILLNDLNDYLVELGSHLREEDIQQSDMHYLLNEAPLKSSIKYQNLHLGSQASKSVGVISRLITCNPYTVDFICREQPFKILAGNKEYAKLIPHRNGALQNDYYVLRLLISIVNNISKYRLARQTNDFLLSVIHLLESVALLDNTSHMDEHTVSSELFCKLFKEVIFARPDHETIKKITFLLKICSRYKAFIRYLFKKNSNNELLKAGPRGVLYYNEDVCCFCVLAILLQNYAQKAEKMPLKVCYNMLSFTYNTFKTSHWIHHESEENICACLSQLYKIEIDYVFRGVADFLKYYGDRKKNCHIPDEWSCFFKHEVIQKVLNQMNFNNFELTEKYVMVYSQFKEIETFLRSEGLFNVTQFNVSEELLNIPHKSFSKDF